MLRKKSEEEKRSQDTKLRRLQLLATDSRFLDKFHLRASTVRPDTTRIVFSALWNVDQKREKVADASGSTSAVLEADKSPHDEDAEMERWRVM